MPNDDGKTSTPTDKTAPATDTKTPDLVVEPNVSDTSKNNKKTIDSSEIIQEIITRINDAQNILIALSSNPSVDEMAGAIGLSLFLDKIGKRTTTIYSGATPNALEFLKPEETFESTSDSLQDFVIALNKEKADHLRYKLDGDFVKIYITPYHTRITEEDLDFSYGDFNVDLVLAIDVANGVDLDSALREHGRIMHDAMIVNITNGNPGKLGEIEWSDKSSSSVSEMIANLIYGMDNGMDKEEATAFLTGIVAATDRFSNAKTSPETMRIASKLMESGANQQLISKNIDSNTDNELFNSSEAVNNEPETIEEDNSVKLDIEHPEDDASSAPVQTPTQTPAQVSTPESETPTSEDVLLDDLKAAEQSLSQAGAETTIEPSEEPLKIDSTNINTISSPTETTTQNETTSSTNEAPTTSTFLTENPTLEQPSTPEANESSTENNYIVGQTEEKNIVPPNDFVQEPASSSSEKYGQMLESALSNINSAPQQIGTPITNPASLNTPTVPSNPEINGVPEMNFMPMPGEEILPPPPAPPIGVDISSNITPPSQPTTGIDMGAPTSSLPPVVPIAPATPTSETQIPPVSPNIQPDLTTPTAPQPVDPNSFKIPGM